MNISTRYTSIELVPKYNNHSLGYAPVTVNITGEIRGVFVVYENFCGERKRTVLGSKDAKAFGLNSEETINKLFIQTMEGMKKNSITSPVLLDLERISNPEQEDFFVMDASIDEIRELFYGTPSVLCGNAQLLSGGAGAAAIFCPGVMYRIGKAIGSFFVLPTSVHYMEIVPFSRISDYESVENLKAAFLNQIHNSELVSKSEIITEDIYFYDAKKNDFRKVN